MKQDDGRYEEADVRRFVSEWARRCSATTALVYMPAGTRPTPAAFAPNGVKVLFAAPNAKDPVVSDVVVLWAVLEEAEDWRALLREAASFAKKLLIAVVSNPRPWEGLLHAGGGRRADSDPRRTAVLAPVLWELGRVRAHDYLAVPAWFERMPAEGLVARVARLHAFVVDTAPRTPQGRRRLTSGKSVASPR
jgi:hypothetical protein